MKHTLVRVLQDVFARVLTSLSSLLLSFSPLTFNRTGLYVRSSFPTLLLRCVSARPARPLRLGALSLLLERVHRCARPRADVSCSLSSLSTSLSCSLRVRVAFDFILDGTYRLTHTNHAYVPLFLSPTAARCPLLAAASACPHLPTRAHPTLRTQCLYYTVFLLGLTFLHEPTIYMYSARKAATSTTNSC